VENVAHPTSTIESTSHKGWVKVSHWIITLSFFFLVFTGGEMIMVHPRFYWGEAGNDLTPALFELPVSRNYKHNGWENKTPLTAIANGPISASRTYDIFNQNGWGRSLHFLAGWFLLIPGLIYFIAGIFTGHFRRHLWPGSKEISFQLFWSDVVNHLRMQIPVATNGPHYGLLQKISYVVVIFFLMPVIVMTGMTMSPAITAAYPFLLKVFFGAQSARTLHLFTSGALVLFLLVHVVMIIKSGFKKQIRSMTIGKQV
jgi:thiosulfate reductase cytochrome b subunit